MPSATRSTAKTRPTKTAKGKGRSTATTSQKQVASHDDESSREGKRGEEDDSDKDAREYDSEALDDSDTNTRNKRKRVVSNSGDAGRKGKVVKEYDSDALDEDSATEEPASKRKSVVSNSKKSATAKSKPAMKGRLKSDQDRPQSTGRYKPSQQTRNAKPKSRSTASTSRTRAVPNDDESSYEERAGEEEDYDDEGVLEYSSDALDDSDTDTRKKRKRVVPTAKSRSSPTKGSASPRKRQRKDREEEEDQDEELDLKEGQEIVGVVVQAPKTGRVPPGRISQNTLNFLTKLKDPKCNDREWFKLHGKLLLTDKMAELKKAIEPVYRLAEQEWKDFVDALTTRLTEVDTQVPPLPPKDTIHRIYRDVRFSNDKTPYKRGLSASFSRSGRKGIFAGYHIAVKPGESIIAAGSWCPGRNELATIRTNIQRNSRRLRDVISNPEFVRFFGEPRPRKDGGRQNVFGMDDELKVAPKGVDKGHKDIDLLKCRSFAVVHRFTDSEILDPSFVETVAEVVGVMRPLVHCLNDMMTVARGEDDSDDEDAEDGDEVHSVEA